MSTPIGNMEDITLRAIRVLGEVDLVLAEDTRTAYRLLNHFKIHKKTWSYYSYNEMKRIPGILKKLDAGEDIALISEAGTPLISDPGHKIVVAAIQNRNSVIPIPGSSAILAALIPSGLPTDKFVFEGFLPRKKGRKTRLEKLAEVETTIIIYESANRLQKTLEDIVNILGNRYIVLARELTKKFEEFIRGSAQEIIDKLANHKLKGELVILIAGTRFRSILKNKNGIVKC